MQPTILSLALRPVPLLNTAGLTEKIEVNRLSQGRKEAAMARFHDKPSAYDTNVLPLKYIPLWTFIRCLLDGRGCTQAKKGLKTILLTGSP